MYGFSLNLMFPRKFFDCGLLDELRMIITCKYVYKWDNSSTGTRKFLYMEATTALTVFNILQYSKEGLEQVTENLGEKEEIESENTFIEV